MYIPRFLASVVVSVILIFGLTPLTYASAIECAGSGTIDTAIGCIRVGNVTDTASFFISWGIGLAGGVSTVLIVYSGLLFAFSQGDPKKVQSAKELLTSSISGLVMIIFSVFLLRVIGIDILAIPGL